MIGSVTSLLASHLAAGGLFVTSVLTMANTLPGSFLRFCAASAAGAATLGGLVDQGPSRWIWIGFAVASGIWYALLRGGRGRGKSTAVLIAITSVAALVVSAKIASGDDSNLAIAGAVSSSLLLGAVTVTMLLGHWYLVDTSLSIAPLRDGALWFSIAVFLRWGVVLLVLGYGGWEVLRVNRAADLIFSTNGLFFLFRSLMGLVAPLLLAGLIWQTVKMRSTQSATGLLYVALVLVLFGELVSQFLFVMTGYPL
jgi:hypothetical protein